MDAGPLIVGFRSGNKNMLRLRFTPSTNPKLFARYKDGATSSIQHASAKREREDSDSDIHDNVHISAKDVESSHTEQDENDDDKQVQLVPAPKRRKSARVEIQKLKRDLEMKPNEPEKTVKTLAECKPTRYALQYTRVLARFTSKRSALYNPAPAISKVAPKIVGPQSSASSTDSSTSGTDGTDASE